MTVCVPTCRRLVAGGHWEGLLVGAIVVLMALAGDGVFAQGVATVAKADFRNELTLPPAENLPVNQASSATVYGGHVGPYAAAGSADTPTTPGSTGIRLESSSYGQALASDVPYPDFTAASLRSVQALLYPPINASRAELESTTGWAFRYKTLLYSNDTSGIVAVQNMRRELFDSDEKEKVGQALDWLRSALAWAPYDRNLRHAYLEIFYDELVAESQFIQKGELAQLSAYRLGLLAIPPDKFIIDVEIEVYTNLLEGIRATLGRYGELFTDYGGVDVASVDSSASPGTRFGYYVFREEQPFRNQMAAKFLDEDGVLKTVPDLDPQTGDPVEPAVDNGAPLFMGYKDFVALVTLLRDYTQSAAELARLYGMRGRRVAEEDDIAAGLALINQLQQEVGTEIAVLIGMFPPEAFPLGDASGARAAVNGVQLGLAELAGVRGFLEGRANPLGLHPSFLVLIQEAPGLNPTSEDQPFDSYDSLMRWIRHTPSSPLTYAEQTFLDARDSYQTFRAYADTVTEELRAVEDTYAERHVEITGYDLGDSGFTGTNPREGSELWDVDRTLLTLSNRLGYMLTLQANLSHQVGLATEFVNASTNKVNAIDGVLRSYLGTTASAWDEIHHWKSVSAGAQAAAEAAFATAECVSSMSIDPVSAAGGALGAVGCIVAGAVNTGLQTAAAQKISKSEQQLDYANAAYTARLEMLGAHTEALQALQDFDALAREQISHASDLAELDSMITQELARRSALLRELERIRLNAETGRAAVARRYYADPVHSQRAEAQLLRADIAFRRAQRWAFFVQRALEYKWNKDFVYSFVGGRDYDRGSIFKLRNLEELQELIAAMEDFNTINLLGFNREPFVDRLSLRDDVLLPFAGTGPDTGLRVDPVTGETLAKEELFRLIMKGERSSPFVEHDVSGNLQIKLNTFLLSKPSGFFFLGPTYSPDGSILTAGKHLDKIEWIKFNLVSSTQTEPIEADLRYAGTCYIRKAVPPCFDPINSRRLPGSYRAFPFQYFYTLDNGISFQVTDHQRDTVKLAFAPLSGEPEQHVPGSIYENRFLKERSVATTNLRLTIGTEPSTGESRVDLDHLDDLELYVRHLFVSIPVIPDCP